MENNNYLDNFIQLVGDGRSNGIYTWADPEGFEGFLTTAGKSQAAIDFFRHSGMDLPPGRNWTQGVQLLLEEGLATLCEIS